MQDWCTTSEDGQSFQSFITDELSSLLSYAQVECKAVEDIAAETKAFDFPSTSGRPHSGNIQGTCTAESQDFPYMLHVSFRNLRQRYVEIAMSNAHFFFAFVTTNTLSI